MQRLIVVIFFLAYIVSVQAQNRIGSTKIDGQIVRFMVDENGDTLFISTLDEMSISSPRKFDSDEEYKRYMLYRRYALKVFPYAKEAIRIHREVAEETQQMKKRKLKKYMKEKTEELKTEFEDPLRQLTKTQGKILVKMIERELDIPMYDLIKNLRGPMTATYWSTFSRFYGHRLKDGYLVGEDPILDAVLNDLNISYR